MIASPLPAHELSLVHDHPCDGATTSRFDGMSRRSEKGSRSGGLGVGRGSATGQQAPQDVDRSGPCCCRRRRLWRVPVRRKHVDDHRQERRGAEKCLDRQAGLSRDLVDVCGPSAAPTCWGSTDWLALVEIHESTAPPSPPAWSVSMSPSTPPFDAKDSCTAPASWAGSAPPVLWLIVDSRSGQVHRGFLPRAASPASGPWRITRGRARRHVWMYRPLTALCQWPHTLYKPCTSVSPMTTFERHSSQTVPADPDRVRSFFLRPGEPRADHATIHGPHHADRAGPGWPKGR